MRTIIWDWNGTLLDDAWLCVEIINEMLTKRSLNSVSIDSYAEKFGFPVIEYYKNLGFDFDAEPFEDLATEFIIQYEARKTECELQPEARGLLQAIKDCGCTQSILSAYKQNTLEECLTDKGLTGYFTHIIGSDDHYAASKIDKGIELVKLLGMDPTKVLLVGDTVHDWAVARSMDINCVLVPSGHSTREKLEASGANVVDSLADVFCMVASR